MAAQLEAYLHDDLWLQLAHRANHAAGRLASGMRQLADRGGEISRPRYTVDANCVFACVPKQVRDRLDQLGFAHFVWDGRPDTVPDETRFVCSYRTTMEDIRALLSALEPL